jgi:quercetin dioxygenase-like cupin family protein
MAPLLSIASVSSLLLCLGRQAVATTQSLVVDNEPNHVRPYVIPHSHGFVVQAEDYAVGFPVTNTSTASALSLITLAGPRSQQIPVHYHAQYHETFFVAKGGLQLSVQNETRRLGPLDFASVPVNQNHSFKIVEPDTEVIGVVAPGGFPFYRFVSTAFRSLNNAPWSAFKEFNLTKLELAVQDRAYYDYNPTNYSLDYHLGNGTTNPQVPWHNGENALPNATVPYFIAGGWGPKWLQKQLGQVVALYMSTAESNGRLTLSTVTMQASNFNGSRPQVPEYTDASVAQFLRVLEGQLFVEVDGAETMLATGDTAVVPAGFKYKYWSKVSLTRFYTAAAVVPGSESAVTGQKYLGLVRHLIPQSQATNEAVFPSVNARGSAV